MSEEKELFKSGLIGVIIGGMVGMPFGLVSLIYVEVWLACIIGLSIIFGTVIITEILFRR